jgi:hypothetical protein
VKIKPPMTGNPLARLQIEVTVKKFRQNLTGFGA